MVESPSLRLKRLFPLSETVTFVPLPTGDGENPFVPDIPFGSMMSLGPAYPAKVTDMAVTGSRITFRFAKNMLLVVDDPEPTQGMLEVSVFRTDGNGKAKDAKSICSCQRPNLETIICSVMARYKGGLEA